MYLKDQLLSFGLLFAFWSPASARDIIGGGIYHQSSKDSLTGPVTLSNSSTPGAFSTGSLLNGAGVQFFATRKLGFEMGVNGFHVGKPTGISGSSIADFEAVGQNFAQVRFGGFFQNKSTIR